MLYQYQVSCWVHPQSGFELSDFHRVSSQVTKALKVLFSGEGKEDSVEKAINETKNKHKGMVLIPLVIDSDKPYEDNVEEIEEGIKEKYPDAIIESHQLLDVVTEKHVNHKM